MNQLLITCLGVAIGNALWAAVVTHDWKRMWEVTYFQVAVLAFAKFTWS